MTNELSGRRALVTGAAGGIGRATVATLLEAGATVLGLDHDEAALGRLAAEVGAGFTPCRADLADPDALTGTVERAVATFGAPDVLVNNAGILSPHKLAATTLAEWRRLMAVNLDAALLLTQAVLPGMRASGWGRIINVASFAWKSGGLTAGTGYAVSKAALVGLTFSTARELAGQGITANAVAPAYVVSPMITNSLSAEDLRRQEAAIPVGRLCQPEEVAHAIRFFASPLSGFMTGVVLDMNGGLQFG